MSAFSDRLLDALQKDEPLYDSFLRICREELPSDTDERYQWLRANGYVARDEADINVYVAKVAYRHAPKFKWLYENLFRKFPAIFQNELDIVVWGCGCGLDLLALYDRAMQEDNPQLWLSVRSVTLIDISEVALLRAKEIADVLFPLAKGKVNIYKRNFKAQKIEPLKIPRSFIYTPRLHLVSNVIDLLSDNQLADFSIYQKRNCAREYANRPYFNEFFVAFSPEYRNCDWVSTSKKMRSYKNAWGGEASEVLTEGGEPDQCAYATFTMSSLRRSLPYKEYLGGNRCLRNLSRVRNRILDRDASDAHLARLHGSLERLIVGGLHFFNAYEWVCEHYYQGQCDGILFVAKHGVSIKSCLVTFGKIKINLSEIFWKEILRKNGLGEYAIKAFVDATRAIVWEKCNFTDVIKSEDFILDQPCDFSSAFVIDPNGAKPLPDIRQQMDSQQRKIILDRAQLKRVRGGAGCGKTTTMLWHGVMAVLRTHQPVLIASRTVTLFSHNQRRMAATILDRVPGLEYIERDLIHFKTIDKYLCEHIDSLNRCRFKQCGVCKRMFVRILEKCGESRRPPIECIKGKANIPDCTVVKNWATNPNSIGKDLTQSEKDILCKWCKTNSVNSICSAQKDFLNNAELFGAVMVDEIQSIAPNLVQALYNLTEVGNPNREFYAFCDERQCLKSGAVEHDKEVGKLRVKTPKAGAGKRFNSTWVSLNKPYRQIGEFSGTLVEVSAAFQRLMNLKYGDCETERVEYQPGIANVFSVERICMNEQWMPRVLGKIFALRNFGEKRITVICDKSEVVRSLLSNDVGVSWLSTHMTKPSFKDEQRLRNEFEETEDHIGLTTIELAQGWDFDNVILIITQDRTDEEHVEESVLTGITRAKNQLHIIDNSYSGWVYELLRKYN